MPQHNPTSVADTPSPRIELHCWILKCLTPLMRGVPWWIHLLQIDRARSLLVTVALDTVTTRRHRICVTTWS